MAQLMPVPLTVSCFSKIQIGLPFWYRLTWVVTEKGPLTGVCVCALGYAMYFRFVDDVMFAGKHDGSIGPKACTHDSSTGAAPMRRRSLVSTIALLLAALARKVMKSVMSVRTSVRFHSFEPTDL